MKHTSLTNRVQFDSKEAKSECPSWKDAASKVVTCKAWRRTLTAHETTR